MELILWHTFNMVAIAPASRLLLCMLLAAR